MSCNNIRTSGEDKYRKFHRIVFSITTDEPNGQEHLLKANLKKQK